MLLLPLQITFAETDEKVTEEIETIDTEVDDKTDDLSDQPELSEEQEESADDLNDQLNEEEQDELDIEQQNEEDQEEESGSELQNVDKVPTKSSEPYTDGDKGEHVVELKEKLVRLGFATWSNPSENYGPITMNVVKEFQKHYGLKATGEADQETLAKIDDILNPPYRSGDRGEPVVELKEKLVKLGFANWVNPSINYGSITANRVKQFQEAYLLQVDGIAGEKTLDQLDLAVNLGEYQNGDQGDHVIKLKQDLVRLGFANWNNPSPNYGPITAGVVVDFQKHYGLKATGIADPKTRQKIKTILEPPYQIGDRGEPVVKLKENLVKLGFATWSNPSINYGSITASRVKDFQKAFGLKQTGITDQETLDLLENPKYYDGDHGDHIVKLKKDLVRLGFASWKNPSPNYGSITANVVKDFQNHYGLNVTGIADENTRAKIKEILEPPYQSGDRGEPVVELKKSLVKLGYASWSNPSINYGKNTANRVKDFQRAYGMEENGVVSENLLKKINDLVDSGEFQDGDRGEHVFEMKQKLVQLGFATWDNPSQNYGRITASVVEKFQDYYGIRVSGVANQMTLNKMDNILNSEYSYGHSSDKIKEFKKNLVQLGFANWLNPSPNYGENTAKRVKDFQTYYGLIVNGIGDPVTLAKMEEILNSPYRDGQSGDHIVKMKEDLVLLGFANWSNPSPNFGKNTEQAVKRFQSAYGLPVSGIADEITLAKIEELVATGSYNQETKYDLSLDEAVAIQMKATPQTDSNYAWVSSSYINSKNQVTANALNVRKGPGTSHGKIGTLSKGTRVKVLDRSGNWLAIEYNSSGWVHAHASDVRYYLDPTNFLSDKKQQFQFLDLSKTSGAPVKKLNEYLKGKGVLQGQGQSFIEAGKKHGINEIYLISHALLETGHGTSTLATGVKYNGVTVHNMYGIGAYDSCPVNCGAEHAYEEGWTTVKSAIIGGAGFIGNNYIKSGQNTIYKMRWNPEAMASEGKFGKQYATDVGWASKQVNTMYNLYEEIGLYNLILEIPVYK